MNGEETWGGKQDKRTPLNIFIKQICMSHEEYVYHGGVFNIILHVLPPPTSTPCWYKLQRLVGFDNSCWDKLKQRSDLDP